MANETGLTASVVASRIVARAVSPRSAPASFMAKIRLALSTCKRRDTHILMEVIHAGEIAGFMDASPFGAGLAGSSRFLSVAVCGRAIGSLAEAVAIVAQFAGANHVRSLKKAEKFNSKKKAWSPGNDLSRGCITSYFHCNIFISKPKSDHYLRIDTRQCRHNPSGYLLPLADRGRPL